MKEQEKFYKLPLSTIQGVINFLNAQPVVQLRDLVSQAEEVKDYERTECKHNPVNQESEVIDLNNK